MAKIRILVTDDHAIVRDGICALLALTGDIEAVGVATNGREALEAVAKLSPDVVLMDIVMPIMGGLEATRRIRKKPVVSSVR
jgi:DNA-binding NarL/FixJ family response regulator